MELDNGSNKFDCRYVAVLTNFITALKTLSVVFCHDVERVRRAIRVDPTPQLDVARRIDGEHVKSTAATW